MKPLLPLLAAVILFSRCGPSADEQFEALANEYIQRLMEMEPETATNLGDHRYDSQLNDRSLSGIAARAEMNREYLARLSAIDPALLNTINGVDVRILKASIEKKIFEAETLKEHVWNPQFYNVGSAIYGLVSREFAPLRDRLGSVAARLGRIPQAIEAAKANLDSPPRIHAETALQQNAGTISLIRGEVTELVQSAGVLEELGPTIDGAVEALEEYGTWMDEELLPRSNGDFRLGEALWRAKLRHTLDSEMSKEAILARANTELAATQELAYVVALPLYEAYFPGSASESDRLSKREIIKSVFDRLAEERPDNETIVATARGTLDAAVTFARVNRLVSVPEEPVELIVMPEFQRGVAVAYCDSPGALEPEMQTYYAISPTPADWTAARVASFFKEYNNYMLYNLTVHEAVPGHYLQLAHANRFEAPTLVRAIFSSGPFIEGWAVYAERMMVEEGFGGPEVRMQQIKMRLRGIINAIIDQKIHTEGMTEEEAMALMMSEGFQEEGEAAGKWRRACLTSTQLSTYFVGNVEVEDIRSAYEEKAGGDVDLKQLHDRMLSFGSPPPRYVRAAMGL